MMRRLVQSRTIFLALALCALAPSAFAQCISDPAFQPGGLSIATTIADYISCILSGVSSSGVPCPVGFTSNIGQRIYDGIITSTSFPQVASAALTIYVIIYGISFMLGIVQLTLLDFIGRVVKIGIVISMLQPGSWGWFNMTVVQFFQDGTNWLICAVSGCTGGPLSALDQAMGTALSAKMFVTLVAIFFSGPYGLVLGILLLMSLGTFVSALLQAVWIYLMSMIVRAFLFGLAPIFICCLLFSKTRHLFDGWLNQLINSMLQPVFLFAFFAFFLGLVFNSMNHLFDVNICYMPSQGLFRGTSFDMVMPRFNRNGQPYAGPMGWDDPFPLSIFNIIIFLILTQLAWRFNGIVINIAKEISAASTNLNMGGPLSGMMNPGGAFNAKAETMANRAAKMLGAQSKGVAERARDNTPGVGKR